MQKGPRRTMPRRSHAELVEAFQLVMQATWQNQAQVGKLAGFKSKGTVTKWLKSQMGESATEVHDNRVERWLDSRVECGAESGEASDPELADMPMAISYPDTSDGSDSEDIFTDSEDDSSDSSSEPDDDRRGWQHPPAIVPLDGSRFEGGRGAAAANRSEGEQNVAADGNRPEDQRNVAADSSEYEDERNVAADGNRYEDDREVAADSSEYEDEAADSNESDPEGELGAGPAAGRRRINTANAFVRVRRLTKKTKLSHKQRAKKKQADRNGTSYAGAKAARVGSRQGLVIDAATARKHHAVSSHVSATPMKQGHTLTKDHVCAECSETMKHIVRECKPALRTAREINNYKGTFKRRHNLAKLRRLLLTLAFNFGKWVVHATCLRAEFGCTWWWFQHLHRAAVEAAGVCTTRKTKEFILKWGLGESILVPLAGEHALLSPKQYLDRMGHDSMIEVVSQSKGQHGLCFKDGNNTAKGTQKEFVSFVVNNRTTTGRTPDKYGRHHGEVYYLSSKFKKLRKQSNGQREKNTKVPDAQIMTEEFLNSLKPGIRSVDRSTVALWFKKMFGIGSKLGHTGVHPHKTATCPHCCSYALDTESCEITLDLERRQGSQTATRKATIAELEQSLLDIGVEWGLHTDEAHEAQEAYHASCNGAHNLYAKLCSEWSAVLTREANADEKLHEHVDHFCKLAAAYVFVISSDYQQDKLWPAWNSSPQPGPTYFLSKITEYIQIICAESCGETDGDTRYGRNRAYMRQETIGGAKDANDTISTLVDFLMAPRIASCKQPALHRTGYSEESPLGGTVTAEITPLQAPISRQAGDVWANVITAGYVAVGAVLPEVSLEKACILYNAPDSGWVHGEIIRCSTDRRRRDIVTGGVPNYVVAYSLDPEIPTDLTEISQELQPASYASGPDCGEGSWVLIISAQLTAPNSPSDSMLVKPVGYHNPAGYELQEAPPTTSELAFRNAAGSALVGRKFIQKWPKHGWCVGSIKRQNIESKSLNGTKINFVCGYDDDPEAEQVLQAKDYCADANAPDWSWALLVDAADPVDDPSPASGPAPQISAEVQKLAELISPLQPQAFIRDVLLWMDNCGGTNKNQYVFGSFAIALALSVLDVFRPCFMLAYHGKFGPDILAQKSAGSYNSGDTFNEAMLLGHFSNYADAVAYDGTLLHTWKEGSGQLFYPVEHITSYREFMLIADDGAVRLGEPAEPSAEYAKRYPDAGDFYTQEALEREAQALKLRSLPGVFKTFCNGEHAGVGAGQTQDSARFLPRSCSKLRKVRLFKKIRDTDTMWIEQDRYQKTQDVVEFCKELAKVVPYENSSIPSQTAKAYWGARAQQIKDQMSKYVPPKYVPDEYSVASGGLTGLIRTSCNSTHQQQHVDTTTAIETATGTPKRNYNKTTDDSVLVALCPKNPAGKPMVVCKTAEIVALAKKVDPNLAYQSVKRALKRLEKAQQLAPRQ